MRKSITERWTCWKEALFFLLRKKDWCAWNEKTDILRIRRSRWEQGGLWGTLWPESFRKKPYLRSAQWQHLIKKRECSCSRNSEGTFLHVFNVTIVLLATLLDTKTDGRRWSRGRSGNGLFSVDGGGGVLEGVGVDHQLDCAAILDEAGLMGCCQEVHHASFYLILDRTCPILHFVAVRKDWLNRPLPYQLNVVLFFCLWPETKKRDEEKHKVFSKHTKISQIYMSQNHMVMCIVKSCTWWQLYSGVATCNLAANRDKVKRFSGVKHDILKVLSRRGISNFVSGPRWQPFKIESRRALGTAVTLLLLDQFCFYFFFVFWKV